MDSREKDKRLTVVVRSYKLKELADIYHVSNYLMRKLIGKYKKLIGKREGHFYRADQVEKIFKLIKPPSDIIII